MLELQSVPDTVNFLIAGYVVIGTVGLIYIGSLVLRQRNLRRDVDTIDTILRDEEE